MRRLLSTTCAVLVILALSFSASSALAFRNISLGDKAPDFTLSSLDGKEISLGSQEGKVVILLLWSTDTENKRERAAELLGAAQAVLDEHGDKGVTAISINFDKNDRETIEGVIKESGAKFPTLLDSEGQVYGSYGVFILPAVGIIGKDGTLKKAIGYSSDIDKIVDGEVQVLLGLKTEEELAGALAPEEVVEKSEELKGADRHMNLGRIMAERRLFEQARKEFEKATKLEPDRAEAFIELGTVLIKEGEYDAALEKLTRGLELEPESADAHAGVGLVFFHKDQLDDAIDELEWALEIHPRDPRIHYQLGLAYEKAGDKKEALKLYKSALKFVFKD
jgi:tetratricopeptide (TPR) repeat protein